MFGVNMVVKGLSGKQLDWDYILMVQLMISADVLNTECERKAKANYSNFGK